MAVQLSRYAPNRERVTSGLGMLATMVMAQLLVLALLTWSGLMTDNDPEQTLTMMAIDWVSFAALFTAGPAVGVALWWWYHE